MGECAKIKRKKKEWIDTVEKKGQKLIEEIKIELKFNVRSFFVFLISLMPCRFLSIRTSKREIIINSRCTRATRKKGTKEERGGVLVNSKLLQRLFRRTPCSLSFHPQLPSPTYQLPSPSIPSILIMTMQILFEPFGFFAQILSRDKNPEKRNFRPPPRNSPLYLWESN